LNPVELFETEFKKYIGTKHADAVCNGTAALHTSLLALDIKPGDKVITTAYTFPATVNAILMCGAVPVFADIEKDRPHIDPESVDKLLSIYEGVVGVLPVHLFGEACNMDRLMEITDGFVWVLEDSSQAIGAEYKGKKLGSIGDAGTYSFYASKNLSCYEGGMIATNREDVHMKAQIIRNHGFFKGEMVQMGYNYKMPWNNAFHGWQFLMLHKPSIEAELGRYGPENGYYPRVVYDHPYYKELGITGDCPRAEKLAEKVRMNTKC